MTKAYPYSTTEIWPDGADLTLKSEHQSSMPKEKEQERIPLAPFSKSDLHLQ